jgi:hypothetical protein
VGGYGHSDPCHGAVLVYRGGTFVGSGPGPLYRRDTALHNLVTIGGRGQVGDSCVWYPDFLEDRFVPPSPKARKRDGAVHLSWALAHTRQSEGIESSVLANGTGLPGASRTRAQMRNAYAASTGTLCRGLSQRRLRGHRNHGDPGGITHGIPVAFNFLLERTSR